MRTIETSHYPDLDSETLDKAIQSLKMTESIILGSDRHLDLILETKKVTSDSIKFIRILTQFIEENFSNINDEWLTRLLRISYPMLSTYKATKDVVLKINSNYGFESSIKELVDELGELDEMIFDLVEFKSEHNNDLNEFLEF